MAERDVTKAILREYRARGAWAIKIHGDARQPRVIDILACYKGRFIGIEAKDGPKKDATPMQEETLRQIKSARGISIVAHHVGEAVEVLNQIDDAIAATLSR
jgi:penicillin-binding protein-related factor A (putative recombinase)